MFIIDFCGAHTAIVIVIVIAPYCRQRRSGLPAASRHSSELCPSKWHSDTAADVSQYMSPMGSGNMRPQSFSRSSSSSPAPGRQMLPPDWSAQLQSLHQQQALAQAQQAIQAAERVRLQQLQAQHLAAAAAAKQAEQETIKAQQVQQLIAEQHRQRNVAVIAMLAQMQRGRRLLTAALFAAAELSTRQRRRSFVASLGAPVLSSILWDAHHSLASMQMQPQPNGLQGSLSISAASSAWQPRSLDVHPLQQPSHGSELLAKGSLSVSAASSAWQPQSLSAQHLQQPSHDRKLLARGRTQQPHLLANCRTSQPFASACSRGASVEEASSTNHSRAAYIQLQQPPYHQQSDPQQQDQQHGFSFHASRLRQGALEQQPPQAALEQLPHVPPHALLEALHWQAHNPRVSFHNGSKSLQLR